MELLGPLGRQAKTSGEEEEGGNAPSGKTDKKRRKYDELAQRRRVGKLKLGRGETELCQCMQQGCDRFKYFGSQNQIQNQIRLVLVVLTNTKIKYHSGKMLNFVSPNQIQIQIGLVPLVRTDTHEDTSQPWQPFTINVCVP